MKSIPVSMALLAASVAVGADRFELVNGVAAIANDAVITFQDVRQASAQAVDLVEQTYRTDLNQLRKKRDDAIGDAQELLVERQLILHEFKTAGGNLPDSIIDDEIRDRIRRQFYDRATLIKNLQGMGMTFESYRQRTREEIILNYMDRKNVREALLISPAKIEVFYRTNLARFQLGDQIQLRMITLNRAQGVSANEVKALALDIRGKILAGAKFADMATSYSEGSQRRDGGLLGWVQESALSPLSRLALDLAPGKCSDVIALAREPDDAYWVLEYNALGSLVRGRKYTSRDVFVEERKFDPAVANIPPAQPQVFYLLTVDARERARTRTLVEVREEIEKELIVTERARLRKRWIERLKNRTFVTYF